MTQQNQRTLLEQAQLTDDEIDRVATGGEMESLRWASDAATRKAFETIIRWIKEHDFGVTSDDFAVNLMCKTIADELEAQYKEAHDA